MPNLSPLRGAAMVPTGLATCPTGPADYGPAAEPGVSSGPLASSGSRGSSALRGRLGEDEARRLVPGDAVRVALLVVAALAEVFGDFAEDLLLPAGHRVQQPVAMAGGALHAVFAGGQQGELGFIRIVRTYRERAWLAAVSPRLRSLSLPLWAAGRVSSGTGEEQDRVTDPVLPAV